MEEFGNRSSERYEERAEDIDCPLCKKSKIRVTFISGWMEWRVSRIAAGAKRTRYFHDPKVIVNSPCPKCKASRTDIKEALERGQTKQISHEERLKRLKDAGLPTVIEG